LLSLEELRLVDYFTVGVMALVAVEVLGVAVPAFASLFTTWWVGSFVAVFGAVVVVDVSVEVLWAVEPRAGSDEDSAGEPLGAVVAVRGARVRRDCVIAIGACGCDADAYADLGLGRGRGHYKETQTGDCRCCKDF
jgi:hypothetical protein